MKTAKEWMNEICPPMTPNGQTLITPISWADIQQIQLEAAKWGAEQAAKKVTERQESLRKFIIECSERWNTCINIRHDIITFATNLTIDDLPK